MSKRTFIVAEDAYMPSPDEAPLTIDIYQALTLDDLARELMDDQETCWADLCRGNGDGQALYAISELLDGKLIPIDMTPPEGWTPQAERELTEQQVRELTGWQGDITPGCLIYINDCLRAYTSFPGEPIPWEDKEYITELLQEFSEPEKD